MRGTQLCIALAMMSCSLIGRAEEINYEIFSVDGAGKRTLIGAGVKVYADADFQIERRGSNKETHWSKELELEKGFRIGLSSYREPVVEGFGLWAKRSPCSFSWEWFDAINATHFAKRQEGGRVVIAYTNHGSDLEISRINFDTDVSLRFDESPNTDKTTHRVLIKAGSVLKLPPSVPLRKAAKPSIQMACTR